MTNGLRPGSRQGSLPLAEELSPCPEVMQAFAAFAEEPHVALLESALERPGVGRYSFLTADPFETVRVSRVRYGTDPFARVRELLQEYSAETIPGLPPFQGGAVGLLGYELGGAWEQIPRIGADDFQLPDLVVGIHDWVIAWDHEQNQCWIIAHGFSESTERPSADEAARTIRRLKNRLDSAKGDAAKSTAVRPVRETPRPLSSQTPQRPLPGFPGLFSDFSREEYLRAVERIIEYIYAGDIFQANLSQRLLAEAKHAPPDLYRRLRRMNPAPFAGYFACEDWAIVSASPERFLKVTGSTVETRPIKGTRRRQQGPEADLFTRDALRESEKDQAENVMIVDLLRNDLSRVAKPGSIRVPALCNVETYETVQHLVSEIRGELAADRDLWDLWSAAFPGGSITGAPKVRAMEIIAEQEPTVRGPYCGNLFYAGFDGQCDSSILIRTLICRAGWIQCPVGGGIIAQSDPLAEYEETWHKAEAMLRAL